MGNVASTTRLPLGVDRASAPIFVVGCGRSGTTLLRLMLNRHPQIAMFGESGAFFRFGKYGRLDNQSELNRFLADWRLACERESPRPDMMDSPTLQEGLRAARTYVEATTLVMEEFARLENKRLWGEKTPAHLHRWQMIHAAYPNAKIIHITRDPRPVVSSSISKLGDGRYTPSNIYNAAKYWVRCEAAADHAASVLPGQLLMVRYEDLVREPEMVLREICQFLGASYVPEMLSTADTAPMYAPRHTVRGEVMAHHQGLLENVNDRALEKWRSELSAELVGIVELAVGDWMQKRGYVPSPADARRAPSVIQLAMLEAQWVIFEIRRRVYVSLVGLARRFGPAADA